jgi:hypothetical protein
MPGFSFGKGLVTTITVAYLALTSPKVKLTLKDLSGPHHPTGAEFINEAYGRSVEYDIRTGAQAQIAHAVAGVSVWSGYIYETAIKKIPDDYTLRQDLKDALKLLAQFPQLAEKDYKHNPNPVAKQADQFLAAYDKIEELPGDVRNWIRAISPAEWGKFIEAVGNLRETSGRFGEIAGLTTPPAAQ